MNDTTHELHLIGVAEVHYWHGFDRLIRGLAEYYCTNPDYKVYFHIVGPLSGEREKQEILPVIRDNKLESYVILHGPQHDQRHSQNKDWLVHQADNRHDAAENHNEKQHRAEFSFPGCGMHKDEGL